MINKLKILGIWRAGEKTVPCCSCRGLVGPSLVPSTHVRQLTATATPGPGSAALLVPTGPCTPCTLPSLYPSRKVHRYRTTTCDACNVLVKGGGATGRTGQGSDVSVVIREDELASDFQKFTRQPESKTGGGWRSVQVSSQEMQVRPQGGQCPEQTEPKWGGKGCNASWDDGWT